jgi:tetratricopeptide (TPR) repeat protein
VHKTGNAVMDAFCRNNIAEIALDQGRLDVSERLFHEALHIWRAAEYRSVIASATGNLARLAAHRGQFAAALAGFDEAAAEADHVGGQGEMREILARKAECLLLAGETEAAFTLAATCLDHIRTTDGVPPQLPLLERIRGIVLFSRGAVDEARTALETSLSAARARDANFEMALTLKALADTGAGAGPVELEEWRRQSEAILADLGVEWVPTIGLLASR